MLRGVRRGEGTPYNGLYGYIFQAAGKRVGIPEVVSTEKGWENCHLRIKRVSVKRSRTDVPC